METRLNLAILLDKEDVFLWQFRIINKLINSDSVNLKLLLVRNEKTIFKKSTQFSLFYSLHERIDRFIFRRKIDFDKTVNLMNQFKGIKCLKLSDNHLDGSLSNTDSTDIHNYNLDILLNFSVVSVQSDLLGEFKFGALTYNIGKQLNFSNAPSCYWEVVKGEPEIGVSIQLEHINLLKKAEIFSTGILPYPNSISINRNNLYELASFLIPRIINDIYLYRNSFIEEILSKNKIINKSVKSSDLHFPTSLQAFSNLFLLYFKFLKKKFQYHKIGRWFLLVRLNDNNEFLPGDPASYKMIKPPEDMFWADPFVISNDECHYLFVEEYLYKTDKGHISVLKLDEKGNFLNSETIIEKPYHLSYPHIFKHNESYYMVPETGSNKTIELYRCSDFPYKWVFVKNIMEDIYAKDTTLFFYNDKWWLFTSIIEQSSSIMSFNELFLFYSNDLFSSNWQSHSKNPVVSDLKLSRSAGNLFFHDNKIYRPSQDCSGNYGNALNINCITKLSETEYEEVLINKTEPMWDKKIKGIHTYNFNDKITVLDAFSFRNRINNKY